MVFNSFSFIVFFALVWGFYLALRGRWQARKSVLVAASYLFYAAWNPPLVALLAVSTVVDWMAAKKMHGSSDGQRRRWLILSLVSNLGMLAVFKYGAFLIQTTVDAFAIVGVTYVPPEWGLVLPVGISFYTFQTLSFSIDVYRKKIDPSKSTFVDFALFVSFFPQLVAGPIVRAADFLPQLRDERQVAKRAVVYGAVLVTLGLLQKSVLADTFLAPIVDSVFGADAHSMRDAWLGTLAFSGQIFFDFAGYSTCAIGVAMCFGFALPANFWLPYGAASFSNFWRRWHISLSEWLRDYLYISLGGNRGGEWKTLRNLSLTMLLGGLWHGASWNFVLWGALHGAYLVFERLVFPRKVSQSRGSRWTRWLLVQIAVLAAWVPFRADDFGTSWDILVAMTGLGETTAHTTTGKNLAVVLLIVGGLYTVHRSLRRTRVEDLVGRLSPAILGALLTLAWLALWMAQPVHRSFIYFQF